MADRTLAVVKPVWMKQAEEAKLKSEAEKTAAAKVAFDATFKDVSKTGTAAANSSDSELEEEDLANKPIGPVDPVKCSAAGTGIAGGTACAPSSFVVVTKDSDGRKMPRGGAAIRVRISPGVGVGGSDVEGIVKDMEDGTYTVTYVVPKRGNYMVDIECNGKSISGSPFPVFFSSGTTGTGGLLGLAPQASFPSLVNQTMPNMPNYSGSVSGAFPGLLGMIPGIAAGASGGAVLPGIGATLGEICREYLNGRCASIDCKFSHPPHSLLMTALAATTNMGNLSQVPMAPSAAAMAAAQAIVAAQALQAHAAQAHAQAQAQSIKDSSGSSDREGKADSLKKTLQVSNLSPHLTVDQLKRLFSFAGTVVECTITDSKHFAYIEMSTPGEATAALAYNNMELSGRPLNVEMAKSLPPKPAILNAPLAHSSLPLVMQQAVAMQQMHFQQALLSQQTMTAQLAANRAATMKTATDLAASRAAEISKKLKADGIVIEDEETARRSRSPSTTRAKSRSKSRSPVRFQRRRKSHSLSPPSRSSRVYRSRSPLRSRRYNEYDRRSYRDSRDVGDRSRWRDSGRFRDRHFSVSRRNRSRSVSPARKSFRHDSLSPKRRRESPEHKVRKSSRTGSRSPGHHRRSRSPPRSDDEVRPKHRKRSRSKSTEVKHHSRDKLGESRDEKSKHRDRRHSRSVSSDGKHIKQSKLIAERSDESKSKHSRPSRSKTPEEKYHSRDKIDRSREGKTKYRDRRRSRSTSAEGKHRKGSRKSPRHSDEHTSNLRKGSRSKFAEHKSGLTDIKIDESTNNNVRHQDKRPRKSDHSIEEPDFNFKDLETVKDDKKSASVREAYDLEDGSDGANHKSSTGDESDYERSEAATKEPHYAEEI
ncbi:hypothetical protein RJ640_013984 [Escallonia rubra]|uniref:Uncharacterized protein n=1 Tax=Escallonia rubra TaxID=112253 RepID=A0AA88UPS7_9ASTE|nr:hypothetical protein RJ640_013984 [Escallonia rubra]